MAAPPAAGVGALLAEDGVRGCHAASRIRVTADDLAAGGTDLIYGWGQVNAAKAVAAAP